MSARAKEVHRAASTLGLNTPLGIGTMMWGDTWLDKKVNGFVVPDAQLSEIVKTATNAGVQFFDSAEGYGGGTSEVRLRQAVEHAGVDRGSLQLATKFLPTLWRWTGGSLRRALRGSNHRLGNSCCDIYFIHTPIHPRKLEVWVQAAIEAAKRGEIKKIGVSNFNAEQVRRAHALAKAHGMAIAANQISFNLMVFGSPALRETYETCRELGIAVIAYAPLGQGLLTDGLTPERVKSIRVARMARITYESLTPLRAKLRELADRHNKTMAQVCLNWVVCKGAVPLVGCRKPAQLSDSLGAVDGSWVLEESEVAELDALALGKSTLEKTKTRRAVFVVFISLLMMSYRVSSWACCCCS